MLEIAYIGKLNQTNGLIREMLDSNYEAHIVFHDPKEVLTEKKLPNHDTLDIVIFDLNTSSGFGNIQNHIQQLNNQYFDIPMLVIHPYDGKKFVQPLMEAGANAIIPVAPTEDEVTQAVNEILGGKNYVSLS